jgi:hypothetical protein
MRIVWLRADGGEGATHGVVSPKEQRDGMEGLGVNNGVNNVVGIIILGGIIFGCFILMLFVLGAGLFAR